MKKQLFSILAVGILGSALTGCGSSSDGGTSSYSGSSGNSSGSDTLTLTKTTGDNFKLIWDKKSSGYSEAVEKEINESGEDGNYFLTGNSKTKHTLECTVKNATDTSISYKCVNQNPNAAPIQKNVNFYFESGNSYEFWVNTTTRREHQAVSATVTYDGTSQSLTIN